MKAAWSRAIKVHLYFAGDSARIDAHGYITVLGRVDDVLNVAGHRIPDRQRRDRGRDRQPPRRRQHKFARPDEIRFTDALPKTRSGKIVRRFLKDIAAGKATTGDTSTLEDHAVLTRLQTSDDE